MVARLRQTFSAGERLFVEFERTVHVALRVLVHAEVVEQALLQPHGFGVELAPVGYGGILVLSLGLLPFMEKRGGLEELHFPPERAVGQRVLHAVQGDVGPCWVGEDAFLLFIQERVEAFFFLHRGLAMASREEKKGTK